MIIKSVDINNFLIIGSASIDLHNQGLVRICGDNNDDTTSSSNGSGKSSIIEAIYWALFGDTLRSLKGADGVVNNTVKKDCSVSLTLEDEGKIYRVERYRKHSKKKNNLYLYINDVDSRGKDNRETQAYIESILSIDKMSFANSIVFGQGYSKNLRRFSELTDKEQKECLESILDVEVFSEAHTQASKALKELVRQRDLLQQEGEMVNNSLTHEMGELRDVEESHRSFDKDKKSRIEESRRAQDDVREEVKEIQAQLETIPQHRDEAEITKIITEYEGEKGICEAKKEKIKTKYSELRNNKLVIKNGISKEISSLYAALEKLSDDSDHGESCPYCGALVLVERLTEKRGEIEFDIVDKERTVQSLEEELKSLQGKYQRRAEEINEVIVMLDEVLLNLREERQKVFTLQLAQQKLESKIDYLEARILAYGEQTERIQAEENPHGVLMDRLHKSVIQKQGRVAEINKELKEVEEEGSYFQFWKDGFSRGGIRSYLLDKVIPFLSERANNYLGILTDGGIQVRFNSRKQLSTGEWRENFNVEVFNTQASDTYEGNSGGEKRRIDLAISLAINDFIASRSGKRLNILLLDEVFENIDETGVYYVVKVLEELAKNRSSVFVITHHDSLASYFNETIKMSRQGGLSHVH